ncbi:nucleotide exchange factor GrpE [Planctomycetes bacterium TBK1r]|uniref:Protein GrpE n=1 Tax=Stieleria magnilauensis TaxID=2527963 RepID=A0ABX5Y2R8_9BACT|nr:heat shock protein GrpE [Planctomycetes bacterium TBK1r]
MNSDGKTELENESPSEEDVSAAEQQTTDEAFLDESVADVPPTRDEEMERLRSAAAEADKRVLQAQAEAENFRKRMRRDFEDQVKFASTDLIVDLLQVRDNLNRAIDAAQSGEQGSGLLEGVAMVIKQMDDVLGKHGVVEIPAEGEVFDPNVHEAISQIPSDVESGKVAHVAVSGFKLHDRVIRPSQVVVSTGPA